MKIIGHFKTITHHRHLVILHCFKAGIGFLGLFHDLSKYSPSEFIVGARYYQGTRSPNDVERKYKGYSSAWLHHKGRNKHHYEYWQDYNPQTHIIEPVEMPLKYVKEMFCDRLAASKTYLGKSYVASHPLEYFKNSNAKKSMNEKNAVLLESWLTMLEKHGEAYTFKHIKSLK